MPLKSKSQVRKWYALAEKGEVTEEQLREAIKSSPRWEDLPARVSRKPKRR